MNETRTWCRQGSSAEESSCWSQITPECTCAGQNADSRPPRLIRRLAKLLQRRLLGESQETRLTRIREDLMPNEICPVIPFPSRDPRRGDHIIASYQRTLFDDFRVEPKNILYACEYNPFEAYKQIYWAIHRYCDALTELGGCKAFVSPLSSKLLSVGALLACYDHQSHKAGRKLHIGMPYVESVSYDDVGQTENEPRELYSMWIRGEWEG